MSYTIVEGSLKYCKCPHAVVTNGMVRSGWSRDCPFHGVPAPHAANPAPVDVVLVTHITSGTKTPCSHCNGTGVEP